MKQQEKLGRLDRFTRLVENSGWRPSRTVLTPEDEEILSRAWAKVATENELEALTDLITEHWKREYGQTEKAQNQSQNQSQSQSQNPGQHQTLKQDTESIRVSVAEEDMPKIQERLKQLIDIIGYNATKIGERGMLIMQNLNVRAEFELGGIYNLPESFIERVVDTLNAVDRFEEIEPDGYAFHDIIPDAVLQETKRLVIDTYVELFKLCFRVAAANTEVDTPVPDRALPEEKALPELDVFPGNDGHCTIAIYLDGFDTVEIDVTDTEYHLYILHDPIEDEWIVEENIISRPQLFETLIKHLMFYMQ